LVGEARAHTHLCGLGRGSHREQQEAGLPDGEREFSFGLG
jgi:hypothetical protein